MTREEALAKHLKPITWHSSSSIRARQNLVTSRFETLQIIYPFLRTEEKAQVDTWRINNSHSGLWD
jgi:hypothetical protein